MRLSSYTDYALRRLMYLAVRQDGLPTISEIAQVYGISKNHLMKVAHQLGLGGFIETVRGRNGGLQLGRPAPGRQGQAALAIGGRNLSVGTVSARHLRSLAKRPDSKARNTVVGAGGGFSGIEVATEMPDRLRTVLGADAKVRVVIVDRGDAIAPDMGPGPRPIIESAVHKLGLELRLGAGVEALDETGVRLADGEHIDAATVIWAAGLRASPLTEQFEAEHDRFGRLLVDRDLRVPGVPSIFAAGDTAQAATDDLGHITLMSCQHANRLGAAAGHNTAADLLGVPTEPYRQKSYVTCLDLGAAGAVFTRGWDRVVEMTGDEAKATKREINTKWIYPPAADRAAAFAAAEWAQLVDY